MIYSNGKHRNQTLCVPVNGSIAVFCSMILELPVYYAMTHIHGNMHDEKAQLIQLNRALMCSCCSSKNKFVLVCSSEVKNWCGGGGIRQDMKSHDGVTRQDVAISRPTFDNQSHNPARNAWIKFSALTKTPTMTLRWTILLVLIQTLLCLATDGTVFKLFFSLELYLKFSLYALCSVILFCHLRQYAPVDCYFEKKDEPFHLCRFENVVSVLNVFMQSTITV